MGHSNVYDTTLLTPPSSSENLPAAVCKDASSSSKRVAEPLCYERKMGDTELSYFLPSRQSGVNDMYVPPSALRKIG